MSTDTSSQGERPVVKQGAFNRFSPSAALAYMQPGRTIILSGKSGYKVITADESPDLIERLSDSFARFIDSYSQYFVVDTTARHTVRKELKAHSSDPRYTFELTVAMAASVEDPLAFLRDFGADASVFEAFYYELLEDIARELSNCPVDDLIETQRRLSDYARDLKRDQPFYKGVRIIQFNVSVQYGEVLRKKIEEAELRRGLSNEGEEYLVIDGAVNPDHLDRNEMIKAGLREVREYQHSKQMGQTRDAMQLAAEYAEMAGLEPRKVIRESGLDKRLDQALAGPKDMQAPDPKLLFSRQNTAREEN